VYASTPRMDHPLCAVIRKKLLSAIIKTLADGKHGVLDFCSEIPTHLVYFKDDDRFLNLNSPEDIRKADHITFDPEQTVEHDVLRYHREDGFSRVDDPVVRESLIRIWLNDDEVAVIHALKNELEELAVGFLYTECIINSVEKIQSVECNDKLHSVTVNTSEQTNSCRGSIVRTVAPGCGQVLFAIRPSFAEHFVEVESDIKVKPEKILELMKQLLKSSGLFEETGGVHTSALADCERIIHVTDDPGRHNCVDKLIGRELRNPVVEQSRRMILTSGRISSEIVTKAIRGYIPFLVSHSAPSEGAIQLAVRYGVTLIGFARGVRFNVYSHEERIEK
jgi:FdhD protein